MFFGCLIDILYLQNSSHFEQNQSIIHQSKCNECHTNHNVTSYSSNSFSFILFQNMKIHCMIRDFMSCQYLFQITWASQKKFVKTRNNVTSIPARPGTTFGSTRKLTADTSTMIAHIKLQFNRISKVSSMSLLNVKLMPNLAGSLRLYSSKALIIYLFFLLLIFDLIFKRISSMTVSFSVSSNWNCFEICIIVSKKIPFFY